MFKKLKRAYIDMLNDQVALADDVQYWRVSSCVKVMIWCGVCCLTITALMAMMVMYIAINVQDQPLLANIYTAGIFVGGMIILCLPAFKFRVMAQSLLRRWRRKKQSSTR